MTGTDLRAFGTSVDEFVGAAPWLGAPHAPALATLRALAAELDTGDLSPALVAQFGLTYRNLAKLAPMTPATVDPLEAALAKAAAA
ncbi:hypothetical protein LQ938_09670 [Microbacterium sp. cx-55]|uniref:hypothetical protein n=1 Tax=Microbacterium sp. cx-55 TaxID=2875948 RepID=UPI001CBE5B9D|nr:hypothetical protein [Microbacterium sp. cx-55]MBZ4485971.1 hypothetical protein [Microbacterium sp. cx-55]UGB34155.1 hypothetical protein LQ938_09670 [Microbacterium sp. cx-55]